MHAPHLCPDIHAVTKMADLRKFGQTEWKFIYLTILEHLGQIHQNEISVAEWMILMAISQICQSKISLVDLRIYMNVCHFLLLHAFLDISAPVGLLYCVLGQITLPPWCLSPTLTMPLQLLSSLMIIDGYLAGWKTKK